MTFQYTDISFEEYPGETSLIINSTGCNMFCPWCFKPDLRKKEPISYKQVKEAVDEHQEFITAVVLTGGEPLCNPYLDKILIYIKSKGLKIKINTNGFNPINNKFSNYLRYWVDYLHISLKNHDYCKTTLPSKYDWMLHGNILEYSFVYSSTLMPYPILKQWSEKLNKIITDKWWNYWNDGWSKPDIFTITQIQTGNCLDSAYNDCKVPTRDELLEVAPLFKDIPLKKLIIETKEYGRENVLAKLTRL